jgi:hypothetical protein
MVTTLETDKKALFLNQGTFLKPGDRREQGNKRVPRGRRRQMDDAFSKRSCSIKNLKRDGDSTESHRTFVELLLDDPMRFNEMRADTEARRQTTP